MATTTIQLVITGTNNASAVFGRIAEELEDFLASISDGEE